MIDMTKQYTYDEWRSNGYTVKLFEKATYICGIPKFSKEQVKKWQPRYRKPKYDGFYEQYKRCSCRCRH